MPNGDEDAQCSSPTSGESEETSTRPVSVSAAEIRAVLDTSVLVPPRLRRDLQVAAQAGLFAGYRSPWIIAELNRVLMWRWIQRTSPPDLSRANEQRCSIAAHTMMELLLSTFRLANIVPPYPPAWESLTDQWDHPVWAATAAHAQDVVSENTRDFPPPQADGHYCHEDIEYLTGDTFPQLVAGTDLE